MTNILRVRACSLSPTLSRDNLYNIHVHVHVRVKRFVRRAASRFGLGSLSIVSCRVSRNVYKRAPLALPLHS